MSAYIIIVLVMLCGVIVDRQENRRLGLYTFAVFAVLLIVVGLRDYSMGVMDTEYIYVPKLERYSSYTLEQVYNAQKSKDVVFWLVGKILLNIFGGNIHAVIFVWAIPFLVALCWMVKKYSVMPWFSFILFLGLGYLGMTFYLLRQVIALAFVIISFKFVLEKKPILFVIMVCLASLFHQTALVFLIAYPLSKIKFSYKNYLAILAFIFIGIVAQNTIVGSIFNILDSVLSDSTRYTTYLTKETSLNSFGFAIQILVLVVARILCNSSDGGAGILVIRMHNGIFVNEEDNVKLNLMMNLATVSVCFMSLTGILGEFWRVSCYFGIFMILLLPEAVENSRLVKQKDLLVLAMALIFILYFLIFRINTSYYVPYKFFWS